MTGLAAHKTSWGAAARHGVTRRGDLGNTHTDDDLARALVESFLGDRLDRDLTDPGFWLEPAVGTGAFYLAVLEGYRRRGGDPLALARRFGAVDVDGHAMAVFRQRLKATFGWGDDVIGTLPLVVGSIADLDPRALHGVRDFPGYDVIVTNPPYLTPRNWHPDPARRARMLESWRQTTPGLDDRADLYLRFHRWAHLHLRAPHRDAPLAGGVALFLCADGWLDNATGRPLRADFRAGAGGRGREGRPAVALECLVAWPWAPMFRDDTCPVVTRVRRVAPGAVTETHLVVDDGAATDVGGGWRIGYLDRPPESWEGGVVYDVNPATAAVRWESHRESAAAAAWMAESTANRRQALVTGPVRLRWLDRALADWEAGLADLGEWTVVSGFPWTLNQLLGWDALLYQPGATGLRGREATPAPDAERWAAACPVFFQKQARVGKPVPYRQARRAADLGCRLEPDRLPPDARRILARTQRAGGLWVALAVDRFPLAFYAEDGASQPWVGVSKYAHVATADTDGVPADLLAAVVTSTPALLAMERFWKEGTRKTLRTDEHGYAKEVTRGVLAGWRVPDPRRWDRATVDGIRSAQRARGGRDLARWDRVVEDPDWQRIDGLIADACGVSRAALVRHQALLTDLYWRRMRHVRRYAAAAEAARQAWAAEGGA